MPPRGGIPSAPPPKPAAKAPPMLSGSNLRGGPATIAPPPAFRTGTGPALSSLSQSVHSAVSGTAGTPSTAPAQSAAGLRIPVALTHTTSPWNTKTPNIGAAVTKGLDIGKVITQLAKPTTGDVNPLGHPGWGNFSVDMGVDANAPAGTPIVAPNNSVVTHIDPSWYSGQPQVTMQLTSGPNKGKYWYVAEQIQGVPQVGQTIPKGHTVATYAPSGTGIEIGWAADPSGTTASQADNTVNTAAGNEHRPGGTPEGQQFLSFMQHAGKPQAATTAQINAGLAAKGLSSNGAGGQTTSPSKVQPVSSGQVTPALFAQNLLRGLGAPITKANVQALVGWQNAEGGNWNNSAKFNPLNTTQDAPGSATFQSVGQGSAPIRIYTSWQQGLQATIQTLKNGRYGGILAALKAGNDPNAVAQAIGSSPWGTSAAGVMASIGSATGNPGPSGSLPGGSSPVSGASSGGGVSSSGSSSGSSAPATGEASSAPAQTAQAAQPNNNAAILSSLLKGSQGLWDTGGTKGSGFGGNSPLAYLPPSGAVTQAHQALQQVAGPTTLSAHPQTDVTKLKGAAQFGGKTVSAWVAPILSYAKAHGWNGTVMAGFKGSFPKGGVNVTNPQGLAAALAKSPYANVLSHLSGNHFAGA